MYPAPAEEAARTDAEGEAKPAPPPATESSIKEEPRFAWPTAETGAERDSQLRLVEGRDKSQHKKNAAESHIATVEGLIQPVVLV